MCGTAWRFQNDMRGFMDAIAPLLTAAEPTQARA